MSATWRTRIVRWEDGLEPVEATDELAVEEPLEIRIGGEPVSVTMRTPGHDLELVAGFLLSEGLLAHSSLPLLRHDGPNLVNAAITGLSGTDLNPIRRGTITAAGCGLCGKGSIESIHRHFPPVSAEFSVSRRLLQGMSETFEGTQVAFSRTGGLHAAAIFDENGLLLAAHEDVGRHNAVDKCLGTALLRRMLPLDRHVLLVSSRASFEIMQKALSARIAIIGVVSAPSSLAVELAASSGQTLIGFLRRGRCNVYTHPERILF